MSTGTADQWNRGVFLSVRTLMHLIGAVSFWYGVYYDFSFVKFPTGIGYVQFGGKFKFLTFLDAIIQASYFTLCVLNDLIGTNEIVPRKPSSIRQLKDYIFGAFAWPLALNVGVSFWTLMAIDRELVLPKALDAYFPTSCLSFVNCSNESFMTYYFASEVDNSPDSPQEKFLKFGLESAETFGLVSLKEFFEIFTSCAKWLNHVMHTNIVIFILMELFTTFRQYPSRKSALTGLSIFMFAYLVWIHIIKHFGGVWVYPILNVLEFGQRIVFFIVILIFCLSLYYLGEFLNNKIWAAELRQIKSNAGKRN